MINIPIYIYSILCLVFGYLWIIKPRKRPSNNKNHSSFSILVPVRNEAENIERLTRSIVSLRYPRENFELIIIDDNSNDNTRILAENILSSSDINYRIIENDISKGSPKKRAISTAISMAKYEHIICTDGDCEVPKGWLSSYSVIYSESDAMFVSGPVSFFDITGESFWRNIWNKLQIVEFGSLVGTGAAALWLRNPNMCSGANISYSKTAFKAVNGYEGNEHIASGDDEFLMHKIAAKFKDKVFYNAQKSALVLTNDQENICSFYSQRKRWAGKWTHYESMSPKLLAILIFFINLTTMWAMITLNFEILAIRWISEIFFLIPVLFSLKKWRTIWIIFPLQIIYPFYVLIFGLSSVHKSSYLWKGRKLS